ncbi:hypothetical protein pdam_00003380, partial [Pocillopora damicornis]
MDRKELFIIENPEAIDESEDFDGSMDAIQERIQSFNIHYCLINRLLPNQTSKDEKAKEYFLRCLNHFSSKEKLALH